MMSEIICNIKHIPAYPTDRDRQKDSPVTFRALTGCHFSSLRRRGGGGRPPRSRRRRGAAEGGVGWGGLS